MKRGVKTAKQTDALDRAIKKVEGELDVEVDIHNDEVVLEGKSLDVMLGKDIVKAIDLGFSPDKAFKLLKEGNQLKVVELKNYLSSRKSIDRIKARVIGTNGKTKRLIEEYSRALISVHGDVVSIVGEDDAVAVASRAVEMFINGSKRGSVYHYLEQNQPER